MKANLMVIGILFFNMIYCTAQTNKSITPVVIDKNKTTTQPLKNTSESYQNPNQVNIKKFLFTGSFILKFTEKNAQGKITTGEIRTAYDDYRMATIPLFTSNTPVSNYLRTLFDLKEKTMTMLFYDTKTTKKQGMVMKIPQIYTTNTEKDELNPSTIQKLNEVKIIDGYKCYKWIINYKNGNRCDAWVTNDLLINTAEALAYCKSGMKGKAIPINTDGANINGCCLESTLYLIDGSTVFMKINDIRKGKPDAGFFTTDSYQIADVTGILFVK